METIGQQMVKTEWGGYLDFAEAPAMSPLVQQDIENHIANNIHELSDSDLLIAENRSKTIKYGWPLQFNGKSGQYDYYGVSFLVDNDRSYNNSIKDYNCGFRTYDTPEYNHAGTDIFPWPFYWNAMDEDWVEVVAAADGQIVGKQDGNYDRRCDWEGTYVPNLIAIQHTDGSQTRYFHMKMNSLTSKNIGDYVQKGEFLGYVGSSGVSTGPHLHFESVEDGAYFDPYLGSCGPNDSRWEDQRPYYDSKVNKISTHSAVINGLHNEPCNTSSIDLNLQSNFCEGDRVYLYGFLRDMLNGQGVLHRIHGPNGEFITSWFETITGPAYQIAGYTENYFDIPIGATHGLYQYSILYNNSVYSTNFGVCLSTSTAEIDESANVLLSPNPARESIRISTDLTVPFIQTQVRDITGRVIYKDRLSYPSKKIHAVLPLRTFNSGLYMIQLVDEDNRIIAAKRFIKS
jgi:hypothetical protein